MDVVLVSSALGLFFYVAASTDGGIVLRSPSSPVFTGDDVILYCQYEPGNRTHTQTSFFKNGAEMNTSGRAAQMILSNVTQEDQAFYSCASRDRKLQSPDSWLLVRPDRGNVTSEETPISSNDSWKWIVVSLGLVLVFFSPLAVWLLSYCRNQKFSTGFKQEVPAEGLPATKQDVTEVQWDLSWMEMSNLLDKETLNCGS